MKLRWQAVAGAFLCAQMGSGFAGPVLSQLRSFGMGESAAANPSAEVLQGRDGALYGTVSLGGNAGQGAVYRLNPDGSGFRLLKSFGTAPADGARPMAALLEGSDGALYGTTDEGGTFGFGTVFRLSEDGTQYSVLWNFTGAADGAYPEARLLEASDGRLYGTASGGGTNDYGVVFRLARDGSGFQSLFPFTGTNGANPEGGLLEASDGRLYGTTVAGGAPRASLSAGGTVFALDKSGANFALLQSFLVFAASGASSTQQTNGYAPYGKLVEGADGRLYGTTSAGGTNGTGTVYRLGKDGTGFQVLRHFAASTTTDARIPMAELLQASDGWLYGTTCQGGTSANGALFRLGQDGTGYAVLLNLSAVQGPAAALAEGTDGWLYGTAQFGGAFGAGALFKVQKTGASFTVLTNCCATGGDGQSPYGAPTLASDGRLYGTTRLGGSQGGGSVFSLRFDGLGYRQLSGLDGSDTGLALPLSSVVEATNGLLYGTTTYGGASGSGTAFCLQKDGSGLRGFTSLTCLDPRATLLQASDGLLYGTTVSGGSSSQGTLFRINLNGSGYTVLKNFVSYQIGGTTGPGANPVQGVIEGRDHVLYGTTYDGGAADYGVIYKVNRDGTGYTVLKSFVTPSTDGAYPASPLLEASDGFLYGTTYGGGAYNNAGTVFRIAKNGTGFLLLRSFRGTSGDARHPCGKLVQGADGMLYGTTERGGQTKDAGALYTLSTNGTGYAVLASFGGAAGVYPRGGLSVGPDGAFYGTTHQGGTLGLGTVFRYGTPIEEIGDFQLSAGVATLTCVGSAGTNYWVERSGSLGSAASWAPVCSTNAPANGQFSVRDESPLPGSAFYRLRR